MTRHKHQRSDITYASACDLLEHALRDGLRPRILDALTEMDDPRQSAIALRNAMRSHLFPTDAEPLRLQRIVHSFDTRARRAGLHVLESWDYVAHRFAPDITPVLMLDRCALDQVPAGRQRAALAVLLDHYFLSILGLLVVRAFEEGDPNENIDRATALLRALHGRDRSNCPLVDDVETLLLSSISQYSPDEHPYEVIARRFDVLTDDRRRRMAHACAAVLGGHLRWGMRFMYRRDVALMRADNVVDYPLVIYGVLNCLRDFEVERSADADGVEHARTIEALLNGLSADPSFATNKTPQWLRTHQADHAELRERVLDNRDALLEAFDAHQPSSGSYSPLGFDTNFLCNTVVAMVATAVANDGPQPSLNALFTARPRDDTASAETERYARALMGYAVGNRVASEAPLIVYDPYEAAHAFNSTRTILRQAQRATAVGAEQWINPPALTASARTSQT
ncbi:MAG: hypothetical protein K2R93_07415 [Gemmatimonadaceae bacterium]|nr:hypothetical protein [Gemmatimonadaceae bacterium]